MILVQIVQLQQNVRPVARERAAGGKHLLLTEKQNWLETLKRDGRPDRLVNQFRPLELFTDEPVYTYLFGSRVRGSTTVDRFGTTFLFPEDAPGPMPHVTEENKVLPDVTRWREYVKIPDLRANCAQGWEEAEAKAAQIDRSSTPLMCMLLNGVFEQLHFLMGMEDAMCNLLVEPEATEELISALMDWRMEWARLLVEHLHPDVILSHDDWGSKDTMFMSPDTWRTLFKPYYAKLYGYLKENGVTVIHHADSFLEPIAEDMAEIGVDIWQGVLPSNDIVKLQKQLDGRMVLMGGIDSVVDRVDATEAEIRAEVRRACTAYGPGGHFIPCITYGRGRSIYSHVYDILSDEIDRYNQGK